MTRRFSRWPLAIALTITAGASALAAPAPLVPDMPPAPPAAPPMPIPASSAKEAPPGVAAIVNGVTISRSQVADEAFRVAGAQVVNQLILIELINQEAAKQHVVVTPAQRAAKMAEIRQQAGSYPGGLEAVLARNHQTLATLTTQMTTELKVEALVSKTLPQASSTVKYHARHLLILTSSLSPSLTTPVRPPHTDAEALTLIAKAQAELKSGKSFVDVANDYTEDPSGKGKGGDLGIIDAKTPFDPNFLQAALKLKPGEVTPTPVKSQYGYHLIKIDSTSKAALPSDRKLYDDAVAAERRVQIQQAIPAYIQGLSRRAKIVNYLGDVPTFAPAPGPGR